MNANCTPDANSKICFHFPAQVALRAVIAIPSLIIYPLIPFVILSIFLMYWVAATLYLFSAGEVRVTSLCCGFTFHHTKHIVWAILYHFLSLYWVTHFIMACTVTTLAGAVAAYYWARGETAVRYTTTISNLSAISLGLRFRVLWSTLQCNDSQHCKVS